MIRDSISLPQPHAMSRARVKELVSAVLGIGSAPPSGHGYVNTHILPGLSSGPFSEPQQAHHKEKVCMNVRSERADGRFQK